MQEPNFARHCFTNYGKQAESLKISSVHSFPLIEGDIDALLREFRGKGRAESLDIGTSGDEGGCGCGVEVDCEVSSLADFGANAVESGDSDGNMEGANADEIDGGVGFMNSHDDSEMIPLYLSTVADNNWNLQSLGMSSTNPFDNQAKDNNPASRPSSHDSYPAKPRVKTLLPMLDDMKVNEEQVCSCIFLSSTFTNVSPSFTDKAC